MLEDKIKEVDLLTIKCNELTTEKDVAGLRSEEERNKLKSLMARNTHDMERELEYTREKGAAEKQIEIDTLKKNYTNQILLL